MNGNYEIGESVLGNWTLTRLIGEGSYGKVYEAERVDFGVTYKAAIKIITIPQSQSEVKSARAEGMDEVSVTAYFQSFVEELVQEFVMMSKLKGHSNIVSYEDHTVQKHENGIGWDIIIRMELLTPLLDYMQQQTLTHKDIISLGIGICRALEICQKYNIVHRDIKPENIFVSEIGDYKLGDFGIARTVEKTTGGLSKKGTYTYMAPEVYKEEPYNSSVDIYSLGIVLYRLLNSNRAPFLPAYPAPITHSDREQALVKRMSGVEMPQPAGAQGRLAEIVLKACTYNEKDRYSSPEAMRRDLEDLLSLQTEKPQNTECPSVKTDNFPEKTVSAWEDFNVGQYPKASGSTQNGTSKPSKNRLMAGAGILIVILVICVAVLFGMNKSEGELIEAKETSSVQPTEQDGENTASMAEEATQQTQYAEITPATTEVNDDTELENDEEIQLYPIEGEPELSMFAPFTIQTDYYETILQENTGATLFITSIDKENADIQFALTIASGDLPDILVDCDAYYEGGSANAYYNEEIIDFSMYLSDYAPNYLSWISENADYSNVALDEGEPVLNIYGLDFGDGSGTHTASISRCCENPEAALAVLNYFFTTPSPFENAENMTVNSTKYVTGVDSAAYFRSTPDEVDDNIIGTIPLNAEVGFVENTDSVFSRIKYNGQYGYMKSKYLSDSPEVVPTEEVESEEYTGTFLTSISTDSSSITFQYDDREELVRQVETTIYGDSIITEYTYDETQNCVIANTWNESMEGSGYATYQWFFNDNYEVEYLRTIDSSDEISYTYYTYNTRGLPVYAKHQAALEELCWEQEYTYEYNSEKLPISCSGFGTDDVFENGRLVSSTGANGTSYYYYTEMSVDTNNPPRWYYTNILLLTRP